MISKMWQHRNIHPYPSHYLRHGHSLQVPKATSLRVLNCESIHFLTCELKPEVIQNPKRLFNPASIVLASLVPPHVPPLITRHGQCI